MQFFCGGGETGKRKRLKISRRKTYGFDSRPSHFTLTKEEIMNMTEQQIINVAKICHEANKAYCESLGDNSQVHWDEAPENIKQSAINGVENYMSGKITSSIASHENWLEFKHKDGWVYGEVKNVEKKIHPCMVDYYSLPLEQQKKDELFFAICRVFGPDPFEDIEPIDQL